MIELVKKLRSEQGETQFTPAIDASVPQKLSVEIEKLFFDLFQTTEFQFELPADFSAFIQLFGEGDAHLTRSEGGILYDWRAIVQHTDMVAAADFDGDRSQQSVWLVLGEYSDKHWYYLCCDPISPDFGKVADGEDVSPWNPHLRAWDLDFFETFTVFLQKITG